MSRREEEAAVLPEERETESENDGEEKKKLKEGDRDFLMVATTFIAAMAFQAGISPPGGVWQDDNKSRNYEAGKSIMASKSPSQFISFMTGVTVCLACSAMQFTVLLLKLPYKTWSVSRSFLYFTMGSAIASIVVAYWSSVKALTPDSQMDSVIVMLRITLVVSVVLLPIAMYLQRKLSS